MDEVEDTSDYEPYPEAIFFGEFDKERWPTHELTVIKPQLEREGFYGIDFVFDLDNEAHPHQRVCICTDKDGTLHKFVYG